MQIQTDLKCVWDIAKMNKFVVIAVVLAVAVVSVSVSIDSITARQHSIETINYSVLMPSDFITISPGETRIVNATVVSDSSTDLQLKMAITQQGDEVNRILGGPTESEGAVTASISENFIDISAITPTKAIHKDNVIVTISASNDAESGTYPFSFVLHQQRAGPDVNSVTYFYVIVE